MTQGHSGFSVVLWSRGNFPSFEVQNWEAPESAWPTVFYLTWVYGSLYFTMLHSFSERLNRPCAVTCTSLVCISHSQDHSNGARIVLLSFSSEKVKCSRWIAHWTELHLYPSSPTSFPKVPCICLFFGVTKSSVFLWVQFLSGCELESPCWRTTMRLNTDIS